jgi:hypothetical protein
MSSPVHLLVCNQSPTGEVVSTAIATAFGDVNEDEIAISQNRKGVQGTTAIGSHIVCCRFHEPVMLTFLDADGEFHHEFREDTTIEAIRSFLASSCYHCSTSHLILIRTDMRVTADEFVTSKTDPKIFRL